MNCWSRPGSVSYGTIAKALVLRCAANVPSRDRRRGAEARSITNVIDPNTSPDSSMNPTQLLSGAPPKEQPNTENEHYSRGPCRHHMDVATLARRSARTSCVVACHRFPPPLHQPFAYMLLSHLAKTERSSGAPTSPCRVACSPRPHQTPAPRREHRVSMSSIRASFDASDRLMTWNGNGVWMRAQPFRKSTASRRIAIQTFACTP